MIFGKKNCAGCQVLLWNKANRRYPSEPYLRPNPRYPSINAKRVCQRCRDKILVTHLLQHLTLSFFDSPMQKKKKFFFSTHAL